MPRQRSPDAVTGPGPARLGDPAAAGRRPVAGLDTDGAVPELAAGAAQVWWATPGQARPDHLDLLDAGQRDRHGRLRRPADRDRFAVGGALTRLVLAAHTGRPARDLRFDRTCGRCGEQHGKPTLIGADDLEFSVSHSGDRVVLAVVRGLPVGVDVEQLVDRADYAGLAATALSEAERAEFDRLGREMSTTDFLTYWTRKEAVLKVTGDGLAGGLTAVWVTPPSEPPRLRHWRGRPDLPDRMTLHTLAPGPGHLGALAALGAVPPPAELAAGSLLAR